MKNGFVYFISNKDKTEIKIGFSINPEERVKNINTSRPFCFIVSVVPDCTVKHERMIQGKFAKQRIGNSEWFLYDNEISEYINTHTKAGFFEKKTKEISDRELIDKWAYEKAYELIHKLKWKDKEIDIFRYFYRNFMYSGDFESFSINYDFNEFKEKYKMELKAGIHDYISIKE